MRSLRKPRSERAARSPEPDAAPAAPPQTRPRPRAALVWLAVLGCVLLAGAASYAVLRFVVLSRVPHALLGKWYVVGGDMDGATLEFDRDGKMIGTVNMKGKEGKIKGKAEVDGQTLRITSTNPFTGRAETVTQTIRTLTEDRLVIEDEKGAVLQMERLLE